MNNVGSPQATSWARSRYGFAVFWFLSLLAGWSALRLVLLLAFQPARLPLFEAALACRSGFHRDLFAGLVLILPLLLWFLLIPERLVLTRSHRALFWGAAFVFWFGQVFLFFVEFFFFEEFKSRFNTVAVDYLIYPTEVFINIWESYNITLILLVCLALSLGWMRAAKKLFPGMWLRSFPLRARLGALAAAAALAGVLALTFDFKGAHVCNDRTVNEMANNGAISFSVAAWTRNLDYSAFYKTLGTNHLDHLQVREMDAMKDATEKARFIKEKAYQRVRRLLSEPNTQFVEDGQSIRRRVAGDPARPRLNVVVILEESLGSKFWGCLGRKAPSLTPEMDKLATAEGLLFSNLYACGNRTVRGMEGVLSSFPPLPGDSIVKRHLSDNVETIARLLQRDGYSTLFLYGGRGLFDGMRSYAIRNGYDRFIEQKHFLKPTFATIWGVCDEDLFSRALDECRALQQENKPFFATLLTVSNHKPYTYPEGRIPERPKGRNEVVKYADYCLGKFFREARREPFWTNTVFVVVADHGDRVYGKQSIPIASYEIPLLIVGPAVVKAPGRISQLGCSLDVAPTLLGLIGRPYETTFFGRDLLKCPPGEGHVFLNHNRDIGMLAHDRLVVLGLMHTVEFYQGNPKLVDMNLLENPLEPERELEKDTMALFQVADDLYMHQRYRIQP